MAEPEDESPETTARERRLKKENDELRRRLNEQPSDSKLRAEVVKVRSDFNELKAYVMGFKGDGSGIEFKANVVSLRPPVQKQATASTFQLRVQDEGSLITSQATMLNFVGGLIAATAAGTVVTVTVTTPTPYTLTLKDEGSTVNSATTAIDFRGSTVVAADQGAGLVRVTVTPLKTQEEGSDVADPTVIMNFTGGGATASGAGSTATVNIPGVTSSNTGSGRQVLKAGSATTVVARTLSEGSGITITQNADDITFAVDGSEFSTVIAIEEEGSEITAAVERINFVGETITATAAGNDVTVTMSELVWRTNVGGAATNFNVASTMIEEE